MEVLIALVPLLLMLIERRLATAPQRERAKLEADYDADLDALNRALAEGDHETVTRLFELSRKAAVRRGLRPGAGAAGDDAQLRPDAGAAGDPGGPGDSAQ